MQVFATIYQKALVLAEHRHAAKYLSAFSFAESSFFPIPVDVMLAPMVLSKPNKWWKLALLTTVMSVLGGMLGYFIGSYFIDWATPILQDYGYWDRLEQINVWFKDWGILVILVAGFSPVPYKLFTIGAGSFGMALPPFVLASLLARGLRFFLVSYVVKLSANKIKTFDLELIERIGWLMVLLLLVAMGIKWLI